MRGLRVLAPVVLALGSAVPARALEGAPPFEWFATGPVLAEGFASVGVAVDVGAGNTFVGGTAERNLAVRRWFVAPIDVRYGLFPGLEARAVFPFMTGTSDQSYVNYGTGGASEAHAATLSSADFGDPLLALRWQAWTSGDERAVVALEAGLGLPLGTNVWSYNQDNFITGPATPDLAISDGAWKIPVGADLRAEPGGGRVDAFLGWIAKLPVEAVAIEPGLSTIEVHLPSPLVGRVRAGWPVAEGWRLAGQVDATWAPAGSFAPGGLLARDPASLGVMLDSYFNLVKASAGCWAGLGLDREVSDVFAASVTVLAPVAEARAYRAVRAGVSVRYAWKP